MGKIFAIFFAVASILLVLGIIYQFQMSQRMVTTEGEINNTPKGDFKDIYVRHGIDWHSATPSGRAYYVDVAYKYSVNGNTLEGEELRIDGNGYILEKNAERVVEVLKKEKKVTVWYDPLNPKRAVLLKPEIQMKAIIYLLVCIFLSYISYRYLDKVILYLGRFKKAR